MIYIVAAEYHFTPQPEMAHYYGGGVYQDQMLSYLQDFKFIHRSKIVARLAHWLQPSRQ